MAEHHKLVRCERCKKYKRRLYDIGGMLICTDCIRGLAFYEAFKDAFKDPELRGDAVFVGIDIGNMIWFNPFAQAWYYPLILWIFFKTRGANLYLDDLKDAWRYRTPLDKVLEIYVEEGIFKIVDQNEKKVILEGDILANMLEKYKDMPDKFEIISAWVSGCIISRIYAEAEAPDFKALNAVVNCIAEKLVDSEGEIKAQPHLKSVGYKCRKCGDRFPTKHDIIEHLKRVHKISEDEAIAFMEEELKISGYLLDYEYFIKALEEEGVDPERFIDRMHRFAILFSRDSESPRFVEQEGKKYLVIEPAWARLVARTRVYERKLIRERLR